MVKRRGFTLIELLLVLVIMSMLAGLAAPLVTSAITKSKEAALKENLMIMRRALDEYYADKGEYPASPESLIEARYLRFIPEDPFTGEREWSWLEAEDMDMFGIADVKSVSGKVALDGTTYENW